MLLVAKTEKSARYLRSSPNEYVVVRPLGVWDEPSEELGVLMIQGDQVTWGRYMTSRRDIAAVLVESALNPQATNKTFEIFNVASPDVEGWREDFQRLRPDQTGAHISP